MSKKKEEIIKNDRRTFLSVMPLGLLGVVGATLTVAAKRSLDPQADAAVGEAWKTIGDAAELSGTDPVEKSISITCRSGWSQTVEDVSVFVLPEHNNKVLSSVCPHEGCPIVWESTEKKFLCPCHDSFFSEEGQRLTGPATKDLTEYESRVENGKLQIKIQ